MATQLRLVDPPPRRPRAARPSARTVAPGAGRSRRSASWGEWRLDDRTRRIGRDGIAAAREALERATADDALRHAS